MPAAPEPDADASLSLFDRAQGGEPGSSLAPDGSDPTVLPMALLALAVASGLAAALALLGGRTTFGLVALGVAALLGWGSRATWVMPVEVHVDRGVVLVAQGRERHRFDLRSDATRVAVHGEPGDLDWQVRFARQGSDPVVVHGGQVDAEAFLAQLREHRPDL